MRRQQPSIDEFLAVRFDRHFEPSDLTIDLDDTRLCNGTLRSNEPFPLSLGELNILRGFEEIGLREVQRFAEELEGKKHLAGSDGVAGNFVNAADDTSNRGDDPAVAETGAVDHDAGYRDRLPEAVGFEWLGSQPQVLLGLYRKKDLLGWRGGFGRIVGFGVRFFGNREQNRLPVFSTEVAARGNARDDREDTDVPDRADE